MTQGTHELDQLREHASLTDNGVGVYQLVKVSEQLAAPFP